MRTVLSGPGRPLRREVCVCVVSTVVSPDPRARGGQHVCRHSGRSARGSPQRPEAGWKVFAITLAWLPGRWAEGMAGGGGLRAPCATT